jgi:hypothetical protein
MLEIHIYLDIIGPLLALPFFIFCKGKKDTGYFMLLLFLTAELVTNSISKWLMFAGPSNIRVYQANALFTFIAVTGWFLTVFRNVMSAKWQLPVKIYSGISLLLLLTILSLEDTSVLNNLSYTFISFNLCAFCIAFYLFSLSSLKEENLIQSFNFRVVTAFFIYYMINFFIFFSYGLFSKLVLRNFQILWAIHNIILFVSCCILAFAIKQRKV